MAPFGHLIPELNTEGRQVGTEIHGYVEINTEPDKGFDDNWCDIVNIGVLGERNYDLFGSLFGIRVSESCEPIAGNRGIPKNTSDKELSNHSESLIGHTWVLWSELEEFFPKFEIHPELKGWIFIFQSMAGLASIYGSESVRLVVYFDNYG